MNDERYYAAYVSSSGRIAWRWSEPFASPLEAKRRLQSEIDSGNYTLPQPVPKIVQNYESLLDSLED